LEEEERQYQDKAAAGPVSNGEKIAISLLPLVGIASGKCGESRVERKSGAQLTLRSRGAADAQKRGEKVLPDGIHGSWGAWVGERVVLEDRQNKKPITTPKQKQRGERGRGCIQKERNNVKPGSKVG